MGVKYIKVCGGYVAVDTPEHHGYTKYILIALIVVTAIAGYILW